MKVAEIMTPTPITVEATALLAQAIATMSEIDVRHLPVVRDGRVVGVVSERDLLQSTGWMWNEERGDTPRFVADIIGTEVWTVDPRETVAGLAGRLVEWGVGCAPVVDGEQLRGMATDRDVLVAFATTQPALSTTVRELMTPDVATLAVTATAEEALNLMRTRNVRHLPVVEDRNVLGIVSDRDLRRMRGQAFPGATPVRDFMTTQVVRATPEDTLSHAARTLAELKISSLPVVERDELVGMLTVTDLLLHCSRML